MGRLGNLTHRIHGAGIFTYIYHKHQPKVGKYTIHGSYRLGNNLGTLGESPPGTLKNPIIISSHAHSIFSQVPSELLTKAFHLAMRDKWFVVFQSDVSCIYTKCAFLVYIKYNSNILIFIYIFTYTLYKQIDICIDRIRFDRQRPKKNFKHQHMQDTFRFQSTLKNEKKTDTLIIPGFIMFPFNISSFQGVENLSFQAPAGDVGSHQPSHGANWWPN